MLPEVPKSWIVLALLAVLVYMLYTHTEDYILITLTAIISYTLGKHVESTRKDTNEIEEYGSAN